MSISVCIPAYNRAIYLERLLDSIYKQKEYVYEVVIVEDCSPERALITEIVNKYKVSHKDLNIRFILNEENLGYDRNFKKLIRESNADYCLFMGNDDVLLDGAVSRVHKAVEQYPETRVISRAYSWFIDRPDNPVEVVRHLSSDKYFYDKYESIPFFFRRVGVLSGLVFHRRAAIESESHEFDGHLYYQMYIASRLLESGGGYYISTPQTASQDGVRPDFGNSGVESKNFLPGRYTYKARVHMVGGLISIIDALGDEKLKTLIISDLSKYFYPYVRDQAGLKWSDYKKMIHEFEGLGFKGRGWFYFHCYVSYIIRPRNYDRVVSVVRKLLGKTPSL